MKRVFWLALATALLSAGVLGCGDDTSSPQGAGSVSGTVTFLNAASWPATGDVQVGIYSHLEAPNYAPTGPPDAFTNAIAKPATGQYTYQLDGLDNGTYAGILVSWREPSNPSGARMLGMYWIYPDSVGVEPSGVVAKAPGPTPVVISSSNPKHTGLNVTADIGIVP